MPSELPISMDLNDENSTYVDRFPINFIEDNTFNSENPNSTQLNNICNENSSSNAIILAKKNQFHQATKFKNKEKTGKNLSKNKN